MVMQLLASGYTQSPEGSTGCEGIYLLQWDENTGCLTKAFSTGGSVNPSFLARTSGGILAGCECVGTCYLDGYALSAGSLEKKASVEIPGTALCHVCVWPGEKFATVSNYMTGQLGVAALDNGLPSRLIALEEHTGVGFDANGRQEGPHVHSSLVSPGGKWLLAADLGLDQVFLYRIDSETGACTLAENSKQIRVSPGEGPRHLCFSSDGRYLYLVTEMGCKVHAYSWSETSCATELQVCPALPDSFTGVNLSADIHLSPDGRFLYVSNRGLDGIAVYARDLDTGLLTLCTHFLLDGSWPRNFAISPDGRQMAVACQNSGEILLYPMGANGIPGRLLSRFSIPQASFVCYVPEE